jgi:hypothetical protein
MKERLEKIEENRDKVSPPVYDRVRGDYELRLKEATHDVLQKKNEIDRELVTLYETQKKIASQLESHRHTLEEIKFRNILGEFSEEEYQLKAKEEQEKISKFETILSAVNRIGRYEGLFRRSALSLKKPSDGMPGITSEEHPSKNSSLRWEARITSPTEVTASRSGEIAGKSCTAGRKAPGSTGTAWS